MNNDKISSISIISQDGCASIVICGYGMHGLSDRIITIAGDDTVSVSISEVSVTVKVANGSEKSVFARLCREFYQSLSSS